MLGQAEVRVQLLMTTPKLMQRDVCQQNFRARLEKAAAWEAGRPHA